jgi:hypothetical protein
MTVTDVTLGVFLGAWLLLSAIMQFEVVAPRLRRVRRFDPMSFIPQYNFFAPTPGTRDFHLLMRLSTSTGALTRWSEVLKPPTRAWWNCIWNPGRRERKALVDLAITLTHESKEYSQNKIQVSVPYLVLLNYVTDVAVTMAPTVTQTYYLQFCLAIASGAGSRDETAPLFLSNIHRVI